VEDSKRDTDVAVDNLQDALKELAELDTLPMDDAFMPSVGQVKRLFVYDELMHPSVISRYLKNPRQEMICRAPGFALVFNKFFPPRGSGLASMVRTRRPEDTVWGVTFDITNEKLDDLDHARGVPNRFHQRGLQVADRGGRKYAALTYVISVPDEVPSKPSKSMLELIVGGAKTRGLPDDYIALLEELETLD